jgi:hypothetical protein
MRRLLVALIVTAGIVAGCNLDNPDATPIPTPDLPTVEFIAPISGATVIEGADMTIDIVARDNNPIAGIARIELFLNGAPYREAEPDDDIPVPVFRVEMNWIADGLGFHAFTAVAYRADGQQSDLTDISVEVIAASP